MRGIARAEQTVITASRRSRKQLRMPSFSVNYPPESILQRQGSRIAEQVQNKDD